MARFRDLRCRGDLPAADAALLFSAAAGLYNVSSVLGLRPRVRTWM